MAESVSRPAESAPLDHQLTEDAHRRRLMAGLRRRRTHALVVPPMSPGGSGAPDRPGH